MCHAREVFPGRGFISGASIAEKWGLGVCKCSMFYCMLLDVHSSIAIILMGKRELVALLSLSSWCLVVVRRLSLAVPRGCLQFVIVVFPGHAHLLFWKSLGASVSNSKIL